MPVLLSYMPVDWSYLLDIVSELAFLLIVFGVFLTLALWKGRQALINAIVGLYLALLISLNFPYYDQLLASLESPTAIAGAKLAIFAVFTFVATLIVVRIMPDEFREKRLESLPKKFLLAAVATVLVMVFSFHVLPVTELLTPGTPVQSLFAPESYFFWWLILPLITLFLAV